MQKSQFTDEQIVALLQQAEKGDKPISEVCRQHNIAENTFYRRRSVRPSPDSSPLMLAAVGA